MPRDEREATIRINTNASKQSKARATLSVGKRGKNELEGEGKGEGEDRMSYLHRLKVTEACIGDLLQRVGRGR